MKKAGFVTIIIIFAVLTPAVARDFWTIYGEKITSNYATKVGIGLQNDINKRLSNDELFSVVTKSFSQSLGARLAEVAYQRRGAAIPCIFTPGPEQCFVNLVMNVTFDEMSFMNAPHFSQKFLMKLRSFHTATFTDRFSDRGKRKRADLVPPWKKFNPRFGFSIGDMELVVATPFYTFLGIYVEPQWGTSSGPSLSLMKHPWYMDVFKNRLSVKYRFAKSMLNNVEFDITFRPGWELTLENTLIYW